MSNCLNDATLQAWLDGELPPQSAAALHITACPTCAANAKAARQALSLAADGWEEELSVTIPEARLRDSLDEAMCAILATEPARGSYKSLYWGLAAAAVVLAIGLTVILRNNAQEPLPSPAQEKVAPLRLADPMPIAPAAVAANLPHASDRSSVFKTPTSKTPLRPPRSERGSTAQSETTHHMEQTQQLLRSIRNTELETVDWAYDLQLSRELLNRNRLLRRRAERREDAAAERVLVHLEPILIDIANLSEQPIPDEIDAIKTMIRNQNILTELRLYAARARS